MSIGKLILHSSSAESTLSEAEPLVSSLSKAGLLGQPVDSKQNAFLTGERFLQLISFVGCSTNVCLTPKTRSDDNFCHLTLKGPYELPQLIWDKNCRPPRCPACKKSMTDWKQQISNKTFNCTHCGNQASPDDIAWGRGAGYGRIFIEINNIFPGEARPVHDLLEVLGRLTGTEWNYFFTE